MYVNGLMDLFFYTSTDFVGLSVFDDEHKKNLTLNLRTVKGTESASQVVLHRPIFSIFFQISVGPLLLWLIVRVMDIIKKRETKTYNWQTVFK